MTIYMTTQEFNRMDDCLSDMFNINTYHMDSDVKILVSDLMNSCVKLGIPHTEESKRLISEAMRGREITETHRKKISDSLSGVRKSKEHCDKISKSKQGSIPWNLGIEHSDETKEKIGNKNKGKKPRLGAKLSDKTRKQISNSLKNLPKVSCPHCNKTMDINNAKRWHFDNCKHK